MENLIETQKSALLNWSFEVKSISLGAMKYLKSFFYTVKIWLYSIVFVLQWPAWSHSNLLINTIAMNLKFDFNTQCSLKSSLTFWFCVSMPWWWRRENKLVRLRWRTRFACLLPQADSRTFGAQNKRSALVVYFSQTVLNRVYDKDYSQCNTPICWAFTASGPLLIALQRHLCETLDSCNQ